MNWRRDLATFAPWGHAWLFARTGDFLRSQEILAEALRRGFRNHGRRFFINGSTDGRLRTMERVLRCFCNSSDAGSPSVHEASFRKSSKLQEIGRLVDAFRTFPEKERMAIVMLYVDEVSDDVVREWLGVDDVFLADVRGRFERKISPHDLERARSFRLTEEFLAAVTVNHDQVGGGAFTLGRSVFWLITIASSLALMMPGQGSRGALQIVNEIGQFGLILSGVLAGVFLFLRGLVRAAAPGFLWDDDRPHVLLQIATFVMVPLILAHVLFAADPRLYFSLTHDQSWVSPSRWPELLVIWALEIVALYTVLAHYLPRLARRIGIGE